MMTRPRPRAIAVGLVAVALAGWWLYSRTSVLAPVAPPDFAYVRPPAETTNTLLLFIHGFGSDSTAAWTSASGAYWPELVRTDRALDGFAIATVRFGSPRIRRTVTIEEASTAVGSALDTAGIYSRFANIVVIAHSTGGIVLRRVLNRLQARGQDAALQRVAAVFFFATPTSGAPIADLVKWLSANPQLDDLSPAAMQSYLASVDNDWEDLLRRRDRESRVRPRVYCAYEVLDTAIGPIVPALYSKTRCDEAPRPFDDRDHTTLVKPLNNVDDNVYVWSKSRLAGVTDRSGPVLWDAGTSLGEVVQQLREGFDEGRVPERVRFAADAPESLASLWIPRAPYKRDNWGDLFRAVAATHACLDVRVTAPGREVELGLKGALKRCERKERRWSVCEPAACGAGPTEPN
jgi:pimeloyl-ACP methyl ester carboxylesterase